MEGVRAMVVALITLELRFVAHSLKEKRMLVKAVLSRMKQSHNVSVYEAGFHDVHNRATLAAAWVGPNPDGAHRVLSSLIGIVEKTGAELVGQSVEIL